MAKRTLSATVIDGCTAETRQRHHRIRIEKLHKTSTRTVDCELFWLQNCYLRYFVGLIQRRPGGGDLAATKSQYLFLLLSLPRVNVARR